MMTFGVYPATLPGKTLALKFARQLDSRMAGVTPNPQAMEKTVRDLCGWNRQFFNPRDLNQAADYIAQRFQAYGLQVQEQTFPCGGKTLRNVMVSFGPENAERLVIGAHYDVYGNTPGADDNASGVAGLIELARLLKEKSPELKHHLKHRIDLVAYSMEEQPYPLSGSKAHADWLKSQNIPVKGMVSLEMLGYYDEKPGSQQYPSQLMKWFYPEKGNFIGVVGYQTGFTLASQTRSALKRYAKDVPTRMIYSPFKAYGMDRSDHASYISLGIPAVMVTDTANFRNQNYHQLTDTPETLNYLKMAEVMKGIYALVVNA
jgi:hypothetical protein